MRNWKITGKQWQSGSPLGGCAAVTLLWTRVNGSLFWAHAVTGNTADSMNMLSVGPIYFHLNPKMVCLTRGWYDTNKPKVGYVNPISRSVHFSFMRFPFKNVFSMWSTFYKTYGNKLLNTLRGTRSIMISESEPNKKNTFFLKVSIREAVNLCIHMEAGQRTDSHLTNPSTDRPIDRPKNTTASDLIICPYTYSSLASSDVRPLDQ